MSQGQSRHLPAQALQLVTPNELENQPNDGCHGRGPHMLLVLLVLLVMVVLVLLVGVGGAQSSLERLMVHA